MGIIKEEFDKALTEIVRIAAREVIKEIEFLMTADVPCAVQILMNYAREGHSDKT